MILHTQPTKPWDKHDFLLIEAFEILEAERCGQCGLPKYICHSDDFEVRFRIEEDQCAAMVEKESYEERARGSDTSYKPPLGTRLHPVPYMNDDTDFTRLREPYYLAERARQEEIAESYLKAA
jgi:hypothetical protein